MPAKKKYYNKSFRLKIHLRIRSNLPQRVGEKLHRDCCMYTVNQAMKSIWKATQSQLLDPRSPIMQTLRRVMLTLLHEVKDS